MSESDVDNYEKKVANNQNQRRRLTVIIVRHGERLDYVHRAAGKNWCQANPEQPWNPPLTEKGLSMATQLGAALRQNIMPELGLPPIRAVYTSPFLRCRQTAAGIIQGMSSECIDHQSSDSNRDPIAQSESRIGSSRKYERELVQVLVSTRDRRHMGIQKTRNPSYRPCEGSNGSSGSTTS
jgi:phosphohistidine phosphatase SixA